MKKLRSNWQYKEDVEAGVAEGRERNLIENNNENTFRTN